VVLDAGRFDTADEEVPLKPQWETMSLPTYQGTAAETLREFMYAVVPSPIEGSYGRLVRAFRRNVTDGAPPVGSDLGQRITDVAEDNGVKVAMIVDRILAEDVVRLVCDTVRTVDAGQATVRTLSLNQVRIRLFLVRRQVTEPSRVVFRTMEATFAMRARGSANDMTRTQTILGTAPIGLAH
jgi:hypothetical protein